MIEAKSTQGKSLPFSNIRETQIKCFKNLKKYKEAGIHGMFLIGFSDLKERYMIDSEKILDYIATTDRKSIPVKFLQTEGI